MIFNYNNVYIPCRMVGFDITEASVVSALIDKYANKILNNNDTKFILK